ncbi:nuclear pore complex protein NUP155-like [Euphorbia lathyris]|uniref:nuclear pore complex protein NUP155-like n=1 Tax=Euphorbia lathyris TaxID=212925 RepID=UPI003313DA62
MIDLGLENELLEFGGPDLVPFLQNAGRESSQEGRAVSAVTAASSPVGHSGALVTSRQAKYFELLAGYYVMKRQHMLAAHILLRLAERRSMDAGDVPSLEQRRQYLGSAVLQAKNANDSSGLIGSPRGVMESGLLDSYVFGSVLNLSSWRERG